jgi:hypothetical protein
MILVMRQHKRKDARLSLVLYLFSFYAYLFHGAPSLDFSSSILYSFKKHSSD